MDFKAKYNKTEYINFFRDNLLPEDFETDENNIELDFKSKYFSKNGVTYLGKTRKLDLAVYEVRHSSENDARIGLSRDAFKLISCYNENNALILFVPDNNENYRLSLVTIEPKLDPNGIRVLKEYSNPKRYSYFLGEKAKTHTPEQYLISLGRITDHEDLKKRFSVEVVNKDFYNQIAEMFSKLVGGKRKRGVKTLNYDPMLVLPSHPIESFEKAYKEFAVRLIGRTVFCWFLKKKKSANGIPLISEDVLSHFAVNMHPQYYHSRVEPLFFEVLNTADEQRKAEYKQAPYNTIPFLNGGLFEPHSNDFYVAEKPNYGLKVPDEWWREFIDILEIYNFTIDENTSIDIDLSVDPEMLGRIFENLLAEINPETGETARKSTGSYYTPRPIVEYMVDESLKQHIITKTRLPEEKITPLLDYSIEESGLTGEEENEVKAALDDIKVLDPACGSGAFPMGILQKMLLILQKVDHSAVNSIQNVLKDIKDPVYRKLFEAKLMADDDLDDYARKLSIIRRSIYGIDIQPIATEISKLRFFLSIIVDEKVQDNEKNRGIEPLPNLEFKFVCANTLIPLPENRELFENADSIDALEKLREDYFISYGEDKQRVIKQFKQLQKRIFSSTINLFNRDTGAHNLEKATQSSMLATWSPFFDQTTEWFDAKWMFGVTDGFDLVIGNPPYINANKLKKMLGNENYESLKSNFVTARGTIDIYILFFEFGIKKLKEDGLLTYITPNRYLSASYGMALREYIYKNANLYSIADYSSVRVFKEASTYPIVTILQKKSVHQVNPIKILKYNNLDSVPLKWDAPASDLVLLPEYLWGFLINEKINLVKLLLKQCVSIKKVGKINATSTAKEADDYHYLLSLNTGLKVVNTGTIDRYSTTWGVEFLTDKGEQYLTPKLDINNKIISDNRRDLYKSPKIILAKIALRAEAFYDKNGDFASINTNCIHSFTNNFIPEYVLSWINSKLYHYIYECFFDGLRMAGGYLLFSSPNVRNTYIKQIDLETQQIFKILTDYLNIILSIDKVNHQNIDKSVPNSHIADLFNKIIDGCIYELFFSEHMKKRDLIIVELVERAIIPLNTDDNQNVNIISEVYNNMRRSEINTRLKRFVTDSPEILKVIIQS